MTLTRCEEILTIDALSLWGKDAQMIVCMEELGELIQAIAKEMRSSRRDDKETHLKDIHNIIEEIVDNEVIINQMKVIFNLELIDLGYNDGDLYQMVKNIKESKLNRLNSRLTQSEERRAERMRDKL